MERLSLSVAASIAALLITSPAAAQTASASPIMPVSALVIPTCAVAAAPLAFGTLSLSGGNNDSQTSIVLTCTPGTSFNVGLDNGAHAAGGVRNMSGTLNGGVLPYYIYSNAARTVEWGNTIGTNTVAGSAQAIVTTLPVYGRVQGNASLFPAGGYTDVVTVTVTF